MRSTNPSHPGSHSKYITYVTPWHMELHKINYFVLNSLSTVLISAPLFQPIVPGTRNIHVPTVPLKLAQTQAWNVQFPVLILN